MSIVRLWNVTMLSVTLGRSDTMRPYYDRGPLAQQTPPRTARASVAVLQHRGRDWEGYADATHRTREEARWALKKAKAYRKGE